ncbi:hypothetical protein [Castellaniella sp. S9]|uniref:hypothetical protein n=1 Tax=Castellaniella sp. S9 TaxID=2993652 RepID=UPI0022B5DB29|nr:hypothetical protein [Castellaniella sp. S9]
MKALIASILIAGLAACAAQPRGLTINELETPEHLVTERRRLPVDFAQVQQALFKHEALCGETFVFEMVPDTSAYGRVVYRPTPDAGWDRSVVISLVLLHNRSVNAKAYSYYAGSLDTVYRMFSAMMKPEVCGIAEGWENSFSH